MIKRYTIPELKRLCDTRPTSRSKNSYTDEAAPHWDEGLGMDGTRRALLHGIRRQRLTHLQHRLTSHLKIREIAAQEEVLSPKRGRVDRERYLAGNPMCMWREMPGTERKAALRIGVDICAYGDVSPQVFEQRGAAVLALVHAAERLNIAVSLDAVSTSTGAFQTGPSLFTAIFQLKSYSERMAAGTANFFLAHAAALRRVEFRVIEEEAVRMNTQVAWGYGAPCNQEPLNEKGEKVYDIFIPMWNQVKTPEDLIETAVNWTKIFNKKQEDV